MRLTKFFTWMFIFTILSLAYIQLQVQIYDLGYQGQRKKIQAQKLKEDNGDTAYNICKLKSVNHLGLKLLSEDSKMQFLDHQRIVTLEAPTQMVARNNPSREEVAAFARRPNFLASIFSLKSQAEAEPIK